MQNYAKVNCMGSLVESYGNDAESIMDLIFNNVLHFYLIFWLCVILTC